MNRRVILIGATGAFGVRLARLLAPWPDIELVLAARREAPLQALAAELACDWARFDREHPETLELLRPWAVVDAAGPFQTSDLRLARAAVAAGAHYVDIADGRAFVAAFPGALDAEARAKGVAAITGASSTPALSNAALDAITRDWREIERVTVAISPGARAPRGLSVLRAILSYVGRPVRVFTGGAWRDEPGWSGMRRLFIPGLGPRLASLCETPDLDVMATRATSEARFLAGLELGLLHVGLWLLSWPVRWKLIASLEPYARPLQAMAGLAARLGSDRGGMVVEAKGLGPTGEPVIARWSLVAEANAGPTVPVAAAAAVLRRLLGDEHGLAGAWACVGLLSVDEIVGELAGLPVATRVDEGAPASGALLRRMLGRRAAALPAPVVWVHERNAAAIFQGRGRAHGSRAIIPSLARKILRLPDPGAYPRLIVTIAPDEKGEVWTRDFGARRFSSHLSSLPEPGLFEERLGPLRFAFSSELKPDGFRWEFQRWRLGPLPLPNAWAPRIRAYSFARDGVYRFRVATSHPWVGLIFAYGGRLDA